MVGRLLVLSYCAVVTIYFGESQLFSVRLILGDWLQSWLLWMAARGPQRIASLSHYALTVLVGRLILWLISPINVTGVLRCCWLREKLLAHRLHFKPLSPESVGFSRGFATHVLWLIVKTCFRLLQVKFQNVVGCPLITSTFVGETDPLVRVGVWMNWILCLADAILL